MNINSLTKDEVFEELNGIFSLDLSLNENVNYATKKGQDFIYEYPDDYFDTLGNIQAVNLILDILKANRDATEEEIGCLVLNEISNSAKEKKGFLSKILNILKNLFGQKLDKKEDIKLQEHKNITKSIVKYINDINSLADIYNKDTLNYMINVAYNRESVNYIIKDHLQKLNEYSIFIEKLYNNAKDEIEKQVVYEESINEEYRDTEIVDVIENTELVDSDVNNTNEGLMKLLISQVFSENIFNIFVNYCDEVGLTTFDQLLTFDFSELDKLKGFGVGKKEKLLAKYEEVLQNNSLYIRDNSMNSYEDEDIIVDINNNYRNMSVSILECFDKINAKIIENIQNANIVTIEELYIVVKRKTLMIPNLGATKIKYINEALEKLKLDTEELFMYLLQRIKDNSDYGILVDRAVNEKTLQEIGEAQGVSRERIRQKEKKILKSIESMIRIFIDLNNKEEGVYSLKECLGVKELSEEDNICLNYALKNSDNLNVEYYKEINKFLLNGSKNNIDEEIMNLFNGLSDIVNINTELIHDIQEYSKLKIFTLDEIVKLIMALGYKRISDYLIRGNIYKEKIYTFIVKEYFKEGITFSDENDINKFMDILNKEFSIKDNSIRSIKAKIERNCVLYNRGTYIHEEMINIDNTILESIKDYIDENKQDTLYMNQVFAEFESDLVKCGVDNRYYLQGILKYYYNDIYNFTKDTVYKGDIKYDRNYIFNKYIKDKGRVVTKEDIEKDLRGWTPIMFSISEEECKYVLKWNNGSYIHASLIKSSLEDINEINKVLEKMFEERDSLTDNDIYDKLSNTFTKFFNENGIDNGYKLFSILEYLLSNQYYFRRPYVLKSKPKEAVSAVYFMKKLFRENATVTYSQLKDYCTEIKLNNSTMMQSINKLIRDTIEIEKEVYILKEDFNIEEDTLEMIKTKILDIISNNGYVALRAIKDYSDFPNVGYEWNSYLLRDILNNYISEVKELKRKFYDKRYSSPIIVEKDVEMSQLLDLIIIKIREEFNGVVKESVLEQYLQDKCFVYDKIPYELYESDRISVEEGLISLK